MIDLNAERTTTINLAQAVLAAAKSGNRELTDAEQATSTGHMARIGELDKQIKGRALVNSVMSLGSSEDIPGGGGEGPRYLSLRRPGTTSRIATKASDELLGRKSLNGGTDPLVSVAMDPAPYTQGRPPTSLLEILPAVTRGPVFRWMRQTTRTNLAAPVAVGGLKPTSVYSLTPVDGRLKVIAHLSEPVDTYTLRDGPSLMQFIGTEMLAGLHDAVETQLVSGTGIGENLTGLAATSGIQTQGYTTSPIITARSAITAVETVGHSPYYFVLNPVDWAIIETSQLTAGQFVLNAEGSGNLPVDAALRRLWGVPVTVTMAVAAGTGYLISSDCVQVATDGVIAQEWSASVADDFARNSVRLRVESRFDLIVTRPTGVVKLDLTA
jgi:HK97 family phage major capsid protein